MDLLTLEKNSITPTEMERIGRVSRQGCRQLTETARVRYRVGLYIKAPENINFEDVGFLSRRVNRRLHTQ